MIGTTTSEEWDRKKKKKQIYQITFNNP
jgi:hypothetical protein